ncbi:MAG: hypothetical protein AUK37_05670 [Rhodobacterales bacterium CG2_30_65_12]|nr:MAG: hypothetical protein AUK37_05670 [Rhodobacterales bacterium CG2_30_65_12]
MTKRNRDLPEEVHEAAASAWSKFSDRIAAVPPGQKEDEESLLAHALVDPDAGKSPEQRMIEKIKRRMKEYPEWYETDPARVAAEVGRQLERIGGILEQKLPGAKEPVEVWQIPLSVFNWLVEGESGETFHHGALSAWSSAENFNASNTPTLAQPQREKLRESFFEISPMLLTAVLDEMLKTDLWISFGEKFVGPELKYLVMRVQRPVV